MLSLTLFACAEPSEQAATDPTQMARALKSGTLHDVSVPVMDTHPITLVFEEDGAGGISACNRYFGAYTISETELSFGDITQTMMACIRDEVMDSEAKNVEALGLIETFTATDETLTLAGDGAGLVFALDTGAQS